MNDMNIDSGSQSFLWGAGLFETMLVVRGQIVLGQQHFDRMAASARALLFPEPAAEEWERVTSAALRTVSGDGEHALRVSYVDPGPHDGHSPVWTMIVTAFDIPPVTWSRRRHGRVVLLPSDIVRAMPRYKSLSHLASVIGLRMARDAGADEGLFTCSEDQILEGTATNVFAIDGDVLLTPPVEAGILPGIVRSWVMDNAPRTGLTVHTRLLERDDLLGGSFLTSSLTLLSPIRSVDGGPARYPGEQIDELARLFLRDTGIVPSGG